MCGAKLKGTSLGSTEIEFWPGELKGGSYSAYINTAGSVSLLMQVALPCALFASDTVSLTLTGGTNTEMAPQVDYMTEVFRPVIEKFGATFNFKLIKRGYFPKGGGKVTVMVNPVEQLNPVDMVDQGNITEIFGWSFVAGVLPISLAHRLANSAVCALQNICNNIQIDRYKEDRNVAPNNCAGLM